MFKEIFPKAQKVFIYWLISFCIGIIIQRFLFVLAAMYSGYSFQIGPLNPLIYSGAYQNSLPIVGLFMLPIYYYTSYFFFYGSEFENPKEIRIQAIQLTIGFFFMSIIGELLLWVLMPLPMTVPVEDFYLGAGLWNLLKYTLIAIGTFLGARPYYLKKSKNWEDNLENAS